ncbi:MAG TPA: hypothetical protein VFA48_07890 [Gammaproteobacteria bacterium]|nr:hypothetical protein [Gammaproteobacteria bacterium]
MGVQWANARGNTKGNSACVVAVALHGFVTAQVVKSTQAANNPYYYQKQDSLSGFHNL